MGVAAVSTEKCWQVLFMKEEEGGEEERRRGGVAGLLWISPSSVGPREGGGVTCKGVWDVSVGLP